LRTEATPNIGHFPDLVGTSHLGQERTFGTLPKRSKGRSYGTHVYTIEGHPDKPTVLSRLEVTA